MPNAPNPTPADQANDVLAELMVELGLNSPQAVAEFLRAHMDQIAALGKSGGKSSGPADGTQADAGGQAMTASARIVASSRSLTGRALQILNTSPSAQAIESIIARETGTARPLLARAVFKHADRAKAAALLAVALSVNKRSAPRAPAPTAKPRPALSAPAPTASRVELAAAKAGLTMEELRPHLDAIRGTGLVKDEAKIEASAIRSALRARAGRTKATAKKRAKR